MHPERLSESVPAVGVELATVPLPAPAAKPQVWSAFVAFALLLVAVPIASMLVLGFWTGVELARSGATAPEPAAIEAIIKEMVRKPIVMAVGGLLNFFMEVALALVPAALSALAWRERVRLGPAPRLSPGGWIAACVGVLMLGEAFSSAVVLAGWWDEEGPIALLARASREASPAVFMLMMLTLALGAGVGEELFFRGYLQSRLVQRWGRWMGIGVSSLAFGLIHFDPLHSTLACAIGLFLGWVAERAGSIRPAMLMHVLNNTVSLGTARWAPAGEWPTWAYAATFVLCMAAFAGCVAVLRRTPEAASAPEVPAGLAA